MHEIAEEYRRKKPFYEEFKSKIELLIKELLIQNSIKYHKLESRTKTIIRLEEKIKNKNEKYKNLNEITDLVGIRIITFFEDEVDKIASVINNEFEKDKINTIDKRKIESDRFGYKSLHYVVSLTKDRLSLTEYKRFKNIKAEIQIRSILQHAWAEIEHDIGYKSELSIPNHLKRDFYRAAAIIETLDLEFVKIKTQVAKYETSIENEIKSQPENVDINLNSLNAYVQNSKTVEYVDDELIIQTKKSYNKHEVISIDFLIKMLNFSSVGTIDSLDKLLKLNKDLIVAFAKNWITDKTGIFNKGISIFYLSYVLVGELKSIDFAKKFVDLIFNKEKMKTSEELRAKGQRIIKVYDKIT